MIEAPSAPRETGTPPLPPTPFVGLVPYREEDADFFFGRDDDERIVTGNLRASRLTIVYGSSGVGKTSLLEAGVVYALHRQALANAAAGCERAPFAVCSFRAWRDDPLQLLVETIRGAAMEALCGEELPPWTPDDSLVEVLRHWTARVRTLLVVLDQFEDYFLYHPDEDGPGTFTGEFPAVVNDPGLRVNFVLSLREDAWARLDRFEGRIPRLFANYVRVEHLARSAAREAIEGPVTEWNRRWPPAEPPYAVEPALVDAVVDATAAGRLALGEGVDDAATQAGGGDAIEAPFLQLVMERLWRAAVASGSHALTLAGLEALGGAQRIVDNHLRDALGALTRSEQAVAADVFRYLVTRAKTKIAHSASDLAEWTDRPEPEVTVVLEKLCRGESGRILRAVRSPTEGEATRYELFHDVLAEPILEWRRTYEAWRTRRRFARVGGALLALVGVFAALGAWALVQQQRAADERTRATSLALASAAKDQLDSRPGAALLLGLEAFRAAPSFQARSTMIAALEAARRSGIRTILVGHADPVYGLAVSPDGRTLVSGGGDGTVRLWRARDGKPLGDPLRGHDGIVVTVVFSPDGRTIASAGVDGTVRLWDVEGRRQVGQPLAGHAGPVTGVAFSPDGRTLASSGFNGTLRIWDVGTRRQIGEPLRGHTDSVGAVAFSPDGRTLASAGLDGTVRLWDPRTHRQLGEPLLGHIEIVEGIAFSPDGRILASGGDDKTVRLWDVRTHRPLGEPLRGHTGPVNAVAFSPDGRTLASGSDDATIRIWDLRTRKQLKPLISGHAGPVYRLAFSPDGRTLASGNADGTVQIWSTHGRPQLGQPLRGHAAAVVAVVLSPDGRTLVSAGTDGTIRFWNVSTGQAIGRPLPARAGSVTALAFSPDGSTLASRGYYGTVQLWDARSRRKLGPPLPGGHAGATIGIAFSPDGRTLAASGGQGVDLWDVRTRRPEGALGARTGEADGVAFSPDGRTLAAGNERTVRLWDVRTHRQLGAPLRGHKGPVNDVAFSPDGTTVASASGDGTVRLWGVRSHRLLGQPLRGHADQVLGVAFSPDGRTLASSSSDGTLRLWDVRRGQPLGEPLRGHTGLVVAVAFSPDGRILATGGQDKSVRLWTGFLWNDAAGLEAQVCGLVHGSLTRDEWSQDTAGLPYRTTCPG